MRAQDLFEHEDDPILWAGSPLLLKRRNCQTGVVAAEAEAVGQRDLLLAAGDRLLHHRDRAIRIRLGESAGGRNAVVGDGQRRDDGLQRAGGAERVAERAFDRRDGDAGARLLAGQRDERVRLGGVVGGRARAVGVQMPEGSAGTVPFSLKAVCSLITTYLRRCRLPVR